MAVLFIGLLCMQLLAVYAHGGDSGNLTENVNLTETYGPNENLTEPVLSVNLTKRSASGGVEWSYNSQDPSGPSGWSNVSNHEACAGSDQSPIDIQTAKTILQRGTPLTTYSYDKYSAKTITVKNNGHTVEFNFDFDWDNTNINMIPRISGGRLNGTYVLHSINFHWGSEHAINNQHYPLEAELVHIKYGYKTLTEALMHPEGVSILGVLYKLRVNVINNNLVDLRQSISQVKYLDQTVIIKPFNLYTVFPQNYGTMFTYTGSLTTPPCTGGVAWNIVYQNAYIEPRDLLVFRSLQRTSEHNDPAGDKFIKENSRPIQPLNGRPVYRQSQI